jgi:serpin B
MDAPLTILKEIYCTTDNENRTSKLNEFTSINNYINHKIVKIIDNHFIYSTFSTTYLTLLLYLGSNDTTKEELSNLFGINDDKNDDKIIKNMYYTMSDILSSKYVNMANCYFINKNYYDHIEPHYMKLFQKFGGIYPCDFIKNSNLIVNQINNWIANVSNNSITNSIQPNMISGLTQLIGINVIYFNGELMYKFPQMSTKIGKFTKKNGTIIELPMMNQINEFNYYEDEDLQFIEMLYEDQKFTLGIFLPKNGVNFDQSFYQRVLAVRKTYIKVSIPKFRQKSHINLKNLYHKMNCYNMFEIGKAKFHNIVKNLDGLAVSELYNDTVFVLTDTPNCKIEHKNSPIVSFIVNKPFHYYIKHEASDTIVIYGIYD